MCIGVRVVASASKRKGCGCLAFLDYWLGMLRAGVVVQKKRKCSGIQRVSCLGDEGDEELLAVHLLVLPAEFPHPLPAPPDAFLHAYCWLVPQSPLRLVDPVRPGHAAELDGLPVQRRLLPSEGSEPHDPFGDCADEEADALWYDAYLLFLYRITCRGAKGPRKVPERQRFRCLVAFEQSCAG